MNILLGIVAIVALVLLYQSLRKDMDHLSQRIDKLEESRQKRINVHSLEEIEHAMTALAVLKSDLEIRRNMVDNAIEHLSKAHTPNGKGKS